MSETMITTIIMGVIAIGIAVYNRRGTHEKDIENSIQKKADDLWNSVDQKVSRESCNAFRIRIGKESDCHTRDITEVKECMAGMNGKLEIILNEVRK